MADGLNRVMLLGNLGADPELRMTAGRRERPILFSAEMVRAILAGWKTQTRRVVASSARGRDVHRDTFVRQGGFHAAYNDPRYFTFRPWDADQHLDGKGDPLPDYALRCPYGVPGDRLWVKSRWLITDLFLSPEEWSEEAAGDLWCYKGKAKPEHAPHVRYAAELRNPERFHGAFRSGLHMPRWASRITLEVTSVRVERLQDITEEDAVAEGTPCRTCGRTIDGRSEEDCECFHTTRNARAHFIELWDSINGKRPGCSWADNPWVWVISFRRRVQ